MKFMKLTLTVATLALAVASAASHYNLKFDSPTWAGGTQLKAGDYKVSVQAGNNIYIQPSIRRSRRSTWVVLTRR